MAGFVEKLNFEGYMTISQAAKALGVGENTLRRAEKRGVIKPAKWVAWGKRKPMRVYREVDLMKMQDRGRKGNL